MSKIEEVSFTTYIGFKDKLDSFLAHYGRPHLYIPPDPPIRDRIPRSQRKCRFCDKQMPAVKFKSDPHVIPQLMGVNYGVSDYECDVCNSHFSKFETHFADYLGLTRTLHAVGRKKVPKFKSPAQALIAAQTGKDANSDFITISDENRQNFNFNTEQKCWEIRYTKNTYVPLKVYQILLKIALASLPEHEVKHYTYLKKFILNDQYIEYFSPYAKVHQYTVDYFVHTPYCFIFPKIPTNLPMPMHMVYLCFENIVYQYFLPYHQLDMRLYQVDKSLDLIYTPPLLFGDYMDQGKFRTHIVDFSSSEKSVGETGYVRFILDDNLFTHAYNIKTNVFEERPISMDKITKVFLSKGSAKIDIADLKKNGLGD